MNRYPVSGAKLIACGVAHIGVGIALLAVFATMVLLVAKFGVPAIKRTMELGGPPSLVASGLAAYIMSSVIWVFAHVGDKYRKAPWWEWPLWWPGFVLAAAVGCVERFKDNVSDGMWCLRTAYKSWRTGIWYLDKLIVARRQNGSVALYAWDGAVTREKARKLLNQGVTVELVTPEQADRVRNMFATTSPVGEVLSHEQAVDLLAGTTET